MKKAPLLFGCILLTVFTALPHYTGASPTVDPSPQASKATGAVRKGSLVDLKSVEPLKEAFQRDSGKIRLVALVSPT
ncbi:MAG TPA: hypothetical protein VJ464_23655 [Blastocatellia bacterium]|nr:hypothetical protein [Blastocatellia bacterium]